MTQEDPRRKLIWLLVAINLISGVLWVLASFDVLGNQGGINFLYLAVGVVSLVAGGVWVLSLRSSGQRR
jgi:hypothetical protein